MFCRTCIITTLRRQTVEVFEAITRILWTLDGSIQDEVTLDWRSIFRACSYQKRERKTIQPMGQTTEHPTYANRCLRNLASTSNLIKPSASFQEKDHQSFFAEIPYSYNDHLFAKHAGLNEMRRPDMCDASGCFMQRSPDVDPRLGFPKNPSQKLS